MNTYLQLPFVYSVQGIYISGQINHAMYHRGATANPLIFIFIFHTLILLYFRKGPCQRLRLRECWEKRKKMLCRLTSWKRKTSSADETDNEANVVHIINAQLWH